jgi:type IV pilus assembly protein PilP
MMWVRGALLLLFVACGGDEAVTVADMTARPSAPPAAASPAAAPVAAAPVAAPYRYSAVGKRDPFLSYLVTRAEEARAQQDRREETEKFALDQYALTGLITGTSQPMALVQDPAGKGHVLRIGSRLGQRSGRVTRISRQGLVVVERYRDASGETVRVPVTVEMQDELASLVAEEDADETK